MNRSRDEIRAESIRGSVRRQVRVYVAAPFEDAGIVRAVHDRLRSLGIEPCSTWAESARGIEDFSAFTPARLRSLAEQNDRDVAEARAVLVMARPGAGGEMFAEARLALAMSIPVVWLGRRTLSAWRAGVTRAEDLDDAISTLLLLTMGPTT